ncbi:MAG: hypothetical protein M5U34_02520 [Chloroflexi bacterium]|nr:hypothetical protein [Chloroflexota bacterium]
MRNPAGKQDCDRCPSPSPSSTREATATKWPLPRLSVIPEGEATAAAANNDQAQPTAEPLAEPETGGAVAALPCASAAIGPAVIGFLAWRRFFLMAHLTRLKRVVALLFLLAGCSVVRSCRRQRSRHLL